MSVFFKKTKGVWSLEKTVILKSETEAQKAKRLLSRNGIASKIIKTVQTGRGCSFALIAKGDFYTLVRTLRDNGIEYSFSEK